MTPTSKLRASIKDVREAEGRIRGSILKTPLVRSTSLSESTDAEFYLKLENLQVTGSFKIRGALNKLSQIGSGPASKNGIITASAGNHGQAVALCASKLRLRAKIIVPENTPKMKIDKIRQYGAEVVLHGAIFDQAEQYAKELAAKDSLSYVSAYNDELVIAGHGTIALEILQQAPDIETILVPVGGGGLISGIGMAAKSMRPSIQIIGVQSEASPSMYESLRAKHLVEAKVKDSIAEGLSGNIEAGSITFDFASKYVDRITSSEGRHDKESHSGALGKRRTDLRRIGRSFYSGGIGKQGSVHREESSCDTEWRKYRSNALQKHCRMIFPTLLAECMGIINPSVITKPPRQGFKAERSQQNHGSINPLQGPLRMHR